MIFFIGNVTIIGLHHRQPSVYRKFGRLCLVIRHW